MVYYEKISNSKSMNKHETIAAISTASGYGGVGIIRVSGPEVEKLMQAWFQCTLTPRFAHFHVLKEEQEVVDEVLMLYFPGPNSFTGEDVLEIQGHGSPVVMSKILQILHAKGIRLARPGEFSERAFLNGKKDLLELEAIADLIESKTEKSAQMAARSLSGEFSKRIRTLGDTVTSLRLYVEAAIDFPEEEIDFLSDQVLLQRFDDLNLKMQQTMQSVHVGSLMREGVKVVLMGLPNAGKSSLMNALSGEERSIVTDIPGTTRDVIHHEIVLEGVPITLIDTAGLRESDDVVEQEGVNRALKASEGADHVFWVQDVSKGGGSDLSSPEGLREFSAPLTIIHNKIDLIDQEASIETVKECSHVFCSFKTQEGVDSLKQHLLEQVGLASLNEEGVFLARTRHKLALEEANDAIDEACRQLQYGHGELAAESLRIAQKSLAEMVGEVSSDDLLGLIFSSFCIGK